MKVKIELELELTAVDENGTFLSEPLDAADVSTMPHMIEDAIATEDGVTPDWLAGSGVFLAVKSAKTLFFGEVR